MVTDEPMLRVPEVARRLDVSEYTVRRWLREGKLSGVTYGSDRAGWRVPESEVARFKYEGPRSDADGS